MQQLAQLGLPMQSVPTVAAFWQGQIADLFQGALSESEIRRFVEGLLKLAGGSMPSADLLADAKAALEAGDARARRRAVQGTCSQQEPENADAWGGLIRALMRSDKRTRRGRRWNRCPRRSPITPRLPGHAVRWCLRAGGAQGRRAAATPRRRGVATDPADLQARYDLATALNATGERRARQPMRCSRSSGAIVRWNDDAARLQLLKFFEAWGFDDPATLGSAPQALRTALLLMAAFHPRAEDLPAEFPVFPLTGALLLPRGKLPLQIFEPRYVAMVEDSLGAGRMFGMIQPDPSAPRHPTGPGLFHVGCLGRLSSFSETDDGAYLITLSGVIRFAVAAELDMRVAIVACVATSRRFLAILNPDRSRSAYRANH